MTNISDIYAGQRVQVCGLGGSGAVRQRLMDMGILPRVSVKIERRAPSGDPIWIRLGGTQLSLRRAEAQMVHVTALASTG